MREKFNTEIIKNKIEIIGNKNFVLLSEYTGYNNKIKIKSLNCGHIFDILIGNLLKNKTEIRCPICSKEKTKKNLKPLYKKIDKEEFLNRFNSIDDLVKNYLVISDFSSIDKK